MNDDRPERSSSPHDPERPDTLAVHGAGHRDDADHALVPPIHLSSVFDFETIGAMVETFRGERPGYVYTRYGNPTLTVVERHLARLEGAEAALLTASGMAAISTALLATLKAGDRILSAADVYGGTRNLFGILERFGITVSYFDVEDPAAARRSLDERTRVLYFETPTNPTLKVADIGALCGIAREAGITTVIDNTFATPLQQQPLKLGADVVVHSATKSLAGHDDVTAGVVAGTGAMIDRCREVMKWVGGCLDPHAAWLLERGLKTLGLRTARQSENALRLARWLEARPDVVRVHYPGLESHPGHAVARLQMTRFGGLFAFEIAGGAEAADRFSGGLELLRLAPTLGGVETIYLIPAVSSHIRLSPEARQAIGIADGLIRVSCGIEDPEDLIADFERGFRAARA